MSKRAVGDAAERRALAALRDAGYEIVERNVRFRIGELDIVAWDRGVFVFIEVRSRASARYGGGADAVTVAKQRQVVRVAQAYLASRRIEPAPRGLRFDVVAITGEDVVILRDAFRAG
ncbi:MAG: YraN family protein [Kofleriaceae bacterium]